MTHPVDAGVAAATRALAAGLPKVELHVHLEGSITADRLRRLCAANGTTPDPRSLEPLGPAAGFDSFLVGFMDRLRALRTPDAWASALDDLATAQAERGVLHTEAFCTPTAILRGEIDHRAWEAALLDVARSHRRHGVDVRLVVDAPRPLGPDVARELVALAARTDRELVVGVGVGGPEQSVPTAAFADAFADAAAAGLGRTAHAGEHDGPGSVRDAVTLLGATRIGHACRAVEADEVVRLLAERDVTVDVCPTSNRVTGAWTVGAHPLHALRDAGVRLSVGSDDPALFGCDVVGEWADLMLEHGLRPHDCVGMTVAAVDGCLLEPVDRARLRARVEAGVVDLVGEAATLEAALGR